jgi:Uma2 family endonuclease
MEEVILKIPERYAMTDDELFELCVANKELRIERDEEGQLIIMSPAGSFSSNLNFRLSILFGNWVEANPNVGYGFDSSGGFTLPDRSMRSPDVSFIKKEKWEALKLEEQKKFAPICPDFVIELRSESDSLVQLKNKMTKWIKNGCQLGWLIDPIEKKSYVYKPNTSVEEVIGFDKKLSGGNLLPGFELDLKRLG